jgi:hypothetical protein
MCRRSGLQAVSVLTEEEIAQMSAAAHDPSAFVLLTLSDFEEEGLWRWGDGTLLTFNRWATNEPNGATLRRSPSPSFSHSALAEGQRLSTG